MDIMKNELFKWAGWIIILLAVVFGLGFGYCWKKYYSPQKSSNDNVKTQLEQINSKIDSLKK